MESLPLPILTMISCYRGMIDKAIDGLKSEQLDRVIDEAKKLIGTLECNE